MADLWCFYQWRLYARGTAVYAVWAGVEMRTAVILFHLGRNRTKAQLYGGTLSYL